MKEGNEGERKSGREVRKSGREEVRERSEEVSEREVRKSGRERSKEVREEEKTTVDTLHDKQYTKSFRCRNKKIHQPMLGVCFLKNNTRSGERGRETRTFQQQLQFLCILDCPSLSAKKARETSIDKVSTHSCRRGSSSCARITTKDNGSTAGSGESAYPFRFCKKATSNSSQCSSAINKHQLTTESSNLDLCKVQVIKQSDSSEFSSSIVAKQPTCLDSSSSQEVKLPGIPRPVTPQDTNELDSLEPFSSHVTSPPSCLQLENRVVAKEARSPSKSPQKGKKRKSKKMYWNKQKSHKKNYDVTTEGDEEDTKDLQKLSFLSEEDLKSRRFLLVSLPKQTCPKECPECYTILTFITPNTFNYKIGRVTCPDCNLNIYIQKA
ncbi:hypothetical protein Pcinc_037490 [Petrolisthes cinctipes]|uniref:Uncharacterized protein n=1 Tax=Petrolisthes cinctipes TaxID=88211 RepID=A0AAE1EMI3_PETCI|nr:hypothetical protein Pcinc_037490 [Petrolisthes cinctipes]